MSTVRTGGRDAAGGTRALLALVIGMAVLIAAGVVVVVATLVHRGLATTASRGPAPAISSAAAGSVWLDQPPGSRIVSLSSTDGRVALLVSGGGLPDRVLLLDARDGSGLTALRLGASPALPR